MTVGSLRALEQLGDDLLLALALATAVVCVLAAAALLWRRTTGTAGVERGAYYVGRRDTGGAAVYFVALTHIDRLPGDWPDPAWGPSADGEPLAAAILLHRTGGHRPPAPELSALRSWLARQPEDGFVLEGTELARIAAGSISGAISARRPEDGPSAAGHAGRSASP
jgi:hypothetical protein